MEWIIAALRASAWPPSAAAGPALEVRATARLPYRRNCGSEQRSHVYLEKNDRTTVGPSERGRDFRGGPAWPRSGTRRERGDSRRADGGRVHGPRLASASLVVGRPEPRGHVHEP